MSLSPLLLIPESQREKPGDVLGGYVLERPLGEGATASVFQARHQQLGRAVVLKILRAEHTRNPQARERFVREGRLANLVQHLHVMEVQDLVEAPSSSGLERLFQVMPWHEGETLLERARRRPPSPREAARWMRQVCMGLAACHAAGVVHRDIKPENLWLTLDDEIRILDFGSARCVRDTPQWALRTTHDGAVVGTPLYIAPERLTGHDDGTQADLYSVAAVLYELLTGNAPFRPSNLQELTRQVCEDAPPPLPRNSASGHRISSGMRELVMRALSKAPERRHPSAQVLAQALRMESQETRTLVGWKVPAVLTGLGMLVAAASLAIWGPASRPAAPVVASAPAVASVTASEASAPVPPARARRLRHR